MGKREIGRCLACFRQFCSLKKLYICKDGQLFVAEVCPYCGGKHYRIYKTRTSEWRDYG